ncbi:Atg22p [Sugiyamaella lignohabitans]|uniref:Autophagy-related protein n=1 Tax=Sugiyamaella lignohabitans TaxID=796027 RepID=A0A167DMP9_9ASCO|nr:Atg22p [Sugiyamaella lignohabitans]ANB13080.1 Atg22p [Sugiyamaella lignohabitans]
MSSKDLLGWFSYSWACEPFIVSAVGTYVPILLEQFARENGVWVKDRLTPCMDIPGDGGDISPAPGPKLPPGSGSGSNGPQKCVVPFFGVYIDTSSLALYTFSLSVLVQTIVVISMSGAADRGNFRKKLLIGFAVAGALITCGFLVVTPKHYYVAALLAIFSNSAFGAVSVCGNAFLPILVNEILARRDHKYNTGTDGPTAPTRNPASTLSEGEIQTPNDESHPEESEIPTRIFDDSQETTPLAPSGSPDDIELLTSLTKERANLSNQISGRGVAIGYFAALLVQIGTMILILTLTAKTSNQNAADTARNTLPIQVAIFIVGLWWLIFQIPVALYLPSPSVKQLHHRLRHQRSNASSIRIPGLRASEGTHLNSYYDIALDHLLSCYEYIAYGWHTLYATFKEARQMRDVATFLLGWFVVSDAATTINSAAVLFARAELQMSAPSLAVIGVLTVFSGMFGATVGPKLKGPSGNPINAIVFVILIASVIPLYGIIGFFSKSIGLRHPWEMYVLAAWYGFALGGLNATCRSVFSLLIPKGKETTFFSLFSVTDKGSSIIGPAITGLITDKTHNIRYTFYFLYVMMLLSAAIFYFLLDLDRGRKEAQYLEHVGDEDDELPDEVSQA